MLYADAFNHIKHCSNLRAAVLKETARPVKESIIIVTTCNLHTIAFLSHQLISTILHEKPKIFTIFFLMVAIVAAVYSFVCVA